MGFLAYDIAFLVIFTLWVIWFLHTRKHNLKREGIIYLYRTKLGIKFIEYIGKKYKKTLSVLQYFSIATGYVLMAAILWLLSLTVYTYIKFPQITQVVKAPPILPLIPYFPRLFGLESFFPPLYFTYWIIAILIVAAVHEFSHGFFANLHGLKIKSTGVAFLGPILGAFVEPDESQMQKKGKVAQLSILSGGVFANILTAIFFFILLWLTFGVAFSPAGVLIQGYAFSAINIDEINTVNGLEFDGNFNNFLDRDIIEIQIAEERYLVQKEVLEQQLDNIENQETIFLFLDAPAIRNNLEGAISKINSKDVESVEELSNELSKYSPGDEISLETKTKDETNNYQITLTGHPANKDKAFLGITLAGGEERTGLRKLIADTIFFKDPSVFYEEKSDPAVFVYYLFWWIAIINFFVALFNMLPIGILDGGRFFYLTILGLTKSESITKKAYKFMVYLILLIFILLILSWLYALFI